MRSNIKDVIKTVPVVGPWLAYLRGQSFKSSAEYWDRRYRNGGNSGAGSYNRLAVFKAEFLNGFVEQNDIHSVIEYGCGDGAQLKLACYPSYTGVDVSPKAVELCRASFANDASKIFLHLDEVVASSRADLGISLDVIYHLVEDSIFEAYMQELFNSARRFVIVYSSNMVDHRPHKHVRHREFTKWVEREEPEWTLQGVIKNVYPYEADDPERTSFADFYVFARR